MPEALVREPKRIWLVSIGVLLLGIDIAVFSDRFGLHWRHPDLRFALGLVPLVALGIAGTWWRRERALRRFGEPRTLAPLVAGRGAGWRVTRATALVLGLQLLVIALAGPQYGSRTRVMRKRGVDVVIALDFSKSMLARDVRPNRIERAKAELTRFIDELDGDRVGIVAFAGETMEFPMTVDYAAIGLFLRDLGPYDMPVGGTAIGRALVASQRLLERSDPPRPEETEEQRAERQRSKVVILLTDGEDHEGDPEAAAQDLAAAGIRLYTVGIGSRSGEPIPTYASDGTWTGYLRDEEGNVVQSALTEEGEGALREIAEATGGSYLRAREGSVGIEEIRRTLRGLQQGEQDAREVTVHEERYALVLLPAFLLLLGEALLPDAWIGRRRRRSPGETKRRERKAT